MTRFDDTFYDKYIEEAVKVDRLSVELRTAVAMLELRDLAREGIMNQYNVLREENLVLRDALINIQGFLRNKGYSEDEPLVLGLINEALNWEEGNEI